MTLELKNPLIFFDLETTGINISTDRIIEISYLKVFPNGKEESMTYLVNPEMPIPAESTAIHHISDADVVGKPIFKHIAAELARAFEGSDIAGYNSNRFDVPLLAEELIRADSNLDLSKRKFIDVQTIFHKMEQRTLSAAYKFYCEKDLDGAHSAEADTKATYEVLKSQLDKYASALKNDVQFLAEFSQQNRNVDFAGRIILNDKDQEVFSFGKYKGQPVLDVFAKDPSYYSWMMQSDFPLYTKKILTNIRLKGKA